MTSLTQLEETEVASAGGCRRAAGRRLQECLMSDLGPVLDMSARGMRVLATRARYGRIDVSLYTDRGPICVQSSSVWNRRLGFRRYEVGLAFENIDAETVRQLTEIASGYARLSYMAA